PQTLTLDVPPIAAQRVLLVSYLSFSTAIASGAEVAQLTLGGQSAGSTLSLRAGEGTAEWAYDIPGTPTPAHHRAPLAGRWPGNPQANLYLATFNLPAAARVDQVTVRYVAPAGRLHVQALVVEGEGRRVTASGPEAW